MTQGGPDMHQIFFIYNIQDKTSLQDDSTAVGIIDSQNKGTEVGLQVFSASAIAVRHV